MCGNRGADKIAADRRGHIASNADSRFDAGANRQRFGSEKEEKSGSDNGIELGENRGDDASRKVRAVARMEREDGKQRNGVFIRGLFSVRGNMRNEIELATGKTADIYNRIANIKR